MAEQPTPASEPPDSGGNVLGRFAVAEALASMWNTLVKWSGLVIIVWLILQMVEALAGQTTDADIGIGFALELIADIPGAWSGWTVGLAGVGYGLLQQHLRRNTVERLQGRIQQFERLYDPDRTSSRLTPRGTTRPEDEI